MTTDFLTRARTLLATSSLAGLLACQGLTPLETRLSRQSDAAPLSEASVAQQIIVTVANPSPLLTHRAGGTPRLYPATPGYRVSTLARRQVAGLAEDYALRVVTEWPIEVLEVHCVVYEITDGRPREAVMAMLAGDQRVESVQAMQTFATETSSAYDDPYVTLQSGLTQMDVEGAHRLSRGSGVVVAVIDAGVDAGHPDLAGRVIASADFAASSASDFRNDRHGLAVAGVIAAVADNGLGIVGVAPQARLIALRACWQPAVDERDPAGALCNSLTLAQALAAAIARNVDVINLSLTGPRDSLLERLVAGALSREIVVVGAVAHDSPIDEAFPTAVPGVIAVDTARSPPGRGRQVIPAPGSQILTLQPGGTYDFASGSSLAAAHVTGIVALVLARRPQSSAAEIRRALEDSLAGIVPADSTSPPVVNACLTLARLLSEPGCTRDVLMATPDDRATASASELH